ncbi:hydroxypyruvate isomerase family protein [Candidatus Viridilinea mediisalina]|uniref:Xylose isomerase n=1 Tax=Candidatus Viridilinea mediisalina TaxID=2024553 RepID=A0A2A6RL14_9CHLR|nr:TIM barrel protein [Candidatus Viridilinea mediisalina]PDW03623.1 xylose isomerase [Candidatus Viridilinea mediisalina]
MSNLAPLRFSVCIETMFTEMPFEQRLEYVADLGFSAFEFWSRQGKDMNITLALKLALRLEVSAFIGSRAALVDPAQHNQFMSEITHAAGLAVDLSCNNLIVTSGPALPDVSREEQYASIVAALREAAPIADDADVCIVLQPMNARDNPGTFLTSSDEGFAIVREVNNPHVKLCFDLYHQQISEGNLTTRIIENLDMIGHIKVADVPGRHEPGTGEINFEHIFGVLREHGYRGFVGLEYTPLVDAIASLKAVRALGQ